MNTYIFICMDEGCSNLPGDVADDMDYESMEVDLPQMLGIESGETPVEAFNTLLNRDDNDMLRRLALWDVYVYELKYQQQEPFAMLSKEDYKQLGNKER